MPGIIYILARHAISCWSPYKRINKTEGQWEGNEKQPLILNLRIWYALNPVHGEWYPWENVLTKEISHKNRLELKVLTVLTPVNIPVEFILVCHWCLEDEHRVLPVAIAGFTWSTWISHQESNSDRRNMMISQLFKEADSSIEFTSSVSVWPGKPRTVAPLSVIYTVIHTALALLLCFCLDWCCKALLDTEMDCWRHLFFPAYFWNRDTNSISFNTEHIEGGSHKIRMWWAAGCWSVDVLASSANS